MRGGFDMAVKNFIQIRDKNGRLKKVPVYTQAQMSESDQLLTEAFNRNVEEAIMVSQFRGNPVARYDVRLKTAYLEYPDGRREYAHE